MAMGTATMTASSARWCAREGSRGGNGVQGKREAVEGVEASPWHREGVEEAATAKQEVAGALRARATPRLCLLAEEEEDKGGRRWAGPARWGSWAGWWAARVRPGRLYSFFFCSVSFI